MLVISIYCLFKHCYPLSIHPLWSCGWINIPRPMHDKLRYVSFQSLICLERILPRETKFGICNLRWPFTHELVFKFCLKGDGEVAGISVIYLSGMQFQPICRSIWANLMVKIFFFPILSKYWLCSWTVIGEIPRPSCAS